MRVSVGALLIAGSLLACRDYDLSDRLVNQDGLVPADQYAGYGREPAGEIAVAGEFAQAHRGPSRADLARQAEAAGKYARSLPDVANVKADPQGLLLTVQFKSGWGAMDSPPEHGEARGET